MPHLGYIPDEIDRRDKTAAELLGALTFPDVCMLTEHLPPTRDQSRSNTCVLQAIAAAVDVRESIAGLPRDPISRLHGYWNSRILHGSRRDKGTHIRTACKAMQQTGIPSETVWPFSINPYRIWRQPPGIAYMKAHARRTVGAGYYRINGRGERMLDEIRAAVASGRPVVFGMDVDRAFTKSDGPTLIGLPAGPKVGGHAMCVVGYRADGAFRILNSWGVRWRDGGLAWLMAGNMARARDCWIIEGWPALSQPAPEGVA